MKMPDLTPDQFGALQKSIQQDGVRYPVLLDSHGAVIDGTHRQKVCAELGVDCPTETLAVDDETADRLRVSLNLARRQLTKLDQYEMIAWLAERYAPEAATAAVGRMAEGGKGGLGKGSSCQPLPSRKADEDIAERISQDAIKAGVQLKVGGDTVRRARKAAALSEEMKTAVRAGKQSVSAAIGNSPKGSAKKHVNTGAARTRPGLQEELDQAARIRAQDAGLQYQSMLNAPPAKLNLPLLRRAERISEMLSELIALDPAVAASQLPTDRCRDFTVLHAAWWAQFAAACDERRARETPDLQPRPYRPSHAVLNPVVLGTSELPKEERHLQPGERAVLDWLRTRTDPATATEIAVALRNRSKESIQLKLRTLCASSLVEVAGRTGKESAYRAVVS